MAGLYIHTPYCKSKCIYCDFYSTPHMETMEQYVHSLICEASLRASEIDSNSPSKIEGARGSMTSTKESSPFTTLYIGGGTPSVMPINLLSTLVTSLDDILHLSHVEEFTIEVNPDDVTCDYIKAMRQLGVNRVSMGVQSFNDDDLRAINRRHTAKQAIDAVHMIKDAGISNVSIDLIYGLPGQSLDSWRHNVEQAIALGVQHISAYCLSYEHGTRLWVMREKGKVQEASDELCVAMHEQLVKCLKEAGFEHYEISNFALPGFRSRHNSSYWNYTPYLGLGAAAHSFDGTTRRYNPSSIKEYINALNENRTAYTEEHPHWFERFDEEVMLRLRTSDGLDLGTIASHYGDQTANGLLLKAQPFISQGLLKLNNNTLTLTPQGVMLSDNIICNLMWD